MSTERTLERIDETLDDYDSWDGHSPDAARWDGDDWIGDDWIDERRPEPVLDSRLWDRALQLTAHHPSNWLAQYDEDHPRIGLPSEFTFPQRVIVGAEHGDQIVSFGTPETPTERSRLDAIEEMAQACGLTMTSWQRVMLRRWIGPTLPGNAAHRPHRAAERTRSPRWRAGTRRTKRHAGRRT